MFARQYHSWCTLARMLKSKASVSRIAEQSITFPAKAFSSIFSLHNNNLCTMPNGASDKNYERKNGHPISMSIGLTGLLGVLSNSKDEDEDKKPLSGELKIIEMIKLAKLAQARQEFKKSEQFLHLALRAAYEIQHYQAQRYIIDDMANNAYEAGDFKKAERLFIDMIRHLLQDGVQQDDNSIIHISGKLANLYAMFHDEFKALEGFRYCISNLENKIKKGASDFDTLALYTLILSWFGDFIHNKGDFTQALNLFQQSHAISVKINGEHHPHTLLQLNNMAASYTLMNRLEDAVDCLNKALILAREVKMDDGMKDLPYYFINLANVYLTQVEKSSADAKELLEMAATSCEEGLKLAKMIRARDAVLKAKKCLERIKHYQTL
uniref:EOG090X06TI n=1 Tax=Ceriodaphnia reticulata TaxID=302197 RepID=A0A4Y7LU24_9CRUS|nr:EOG090X06TI [Ceriodaphnia reticulata]SVE72957.1 EOG090X06TI [Ceriodaphnia reticulata]